MVYGRVEGISPIVAAELEINRGGDQLGSGSSLCKYTGSGTDEPAGENAEKMLEAQNKCLPRDVL